ncbi:MAG: sodium:calcium antiporter [Anaerolineales bacterium]|nr:sodium:calcium antiporter [Anaerolineales bacterium]
MVWVIFVITAALIVFAATQLAKYGDIIAVRTHLGGMFIGVLLLAGATSLPEVLTSISSLSQQAPNLAAGNLLGSNTVNMLLLAVIDVVNRKQRILRNAALKHALSGSLAVFLIGLVVFFMLADLDLKIGWVGVDSLVIIAAYVVAVRLIQGNPPPVSQPASPSDIPEGTASLRRGIIGFLIAAGALVVVTPIMVKSADEISVITGLGTTFIGTTLVALVTSLPELVTTLAAIKIGANDMAIGNLFGSNLFNMFAIGLTDLFYTQGRFLAAIDPSFLLIGVVGLLMTGMGLIGNLAKLERKIWFIEIDALALIVVYLASLWLLYSHG